MVITIAILGILLSMALLMVRAFIGKSYFDRILAVNSFGTHIVVLIVLMGFFKKTEFFIDIALIYGLINFITTVAFLRYFKFRR